MNARKLAALRNLAERPGTKAEGDLARELLKKYEGAVLDVPPDEADWWRAFQLHMRGQMSTEELLNALKRHAQRPMPTVWTCACGTIVPVGQKCQNIGLHTKISLDICDRFKKGDCAYYNFWAYPINQPVTVTGYVKDMKQWNWIAVKLIGRRRSAKGTYRQIPIFSSRGFHLSKEPLSDEEAEVLTRAF